MSFIKRVMAKREIAREHHQVEHESHLGDNAVAEEAWEDAGAQAHPDSQAGVAEDAWEDADTEAFLEAEDAEVDGYWEEGDAEEALEAEEAAADEDWEDTGPQEALDAEEAVAEEDWVDADAEAAEAHDAAADEAWEEAEAGADYGGEADWEEDEEYLDAEQGAAEEAWEEAEDAAAPDHSWQGAQVEQVIEITSAASSGVAQSAGAQQAAVATPAVKPGSGLYPAAAVERHAAAWQEHSASGDGAGDIELDTSKLRSTGLIVPRDMEPVFLEEFRRIKRPLLRNAFSRDPSLPANRNVVVVTSALANEGKTFTSFNLAMSISAEREKTVLLIDADLQRGELSSLLGLRHRKGLADRLNGTHNDLSELLVKTNVPKLTILPAGTPSSHSAELLSSETMASLTDELAERYANRLIIIDSSPLLASSLAETISPLVGQIVLVVAAEQTPRKAVEQALAHLHDCELVGLVLNKRINRPGLTYREHYYGSY